MFTNDLTESQKRSPDYKLRIGKALMSPQGSWVNMMLRKNLGDAKVAYFILDHGLPKVLNSPWSTQKPHKALINEMLEELMTWYASLLQSMIEHREHPRMDDARKFAHLGQAEWREQRRKAKEAARQEIREGKQLQKQRDDKKRKYDDMTATEQLHLENFETGKSENRLKQLTMKNMPPFKGKML